MSVSVVESSQVGEARRTATALAANLGFDETARGEIAIVVTELATNLVRHAKAGEIVLRSLPTRTPGLEVLAIDRGPGIANLPEALRDGFSTGGTPGTGLGAVRRLSRKFDLFTSPQSGTALVAQFFEREEADDADAAPALNVGCVCLPKQGEVACGDAYRVEHLDGGARTVVLVADGLGHGLQAADASRQAVRLFRENPALDGPQLLDILHAGLRSTRGRAVAVADVRHGQGELRFTGVGNISGTLVNGTTTRSMVSQNGTVGAEARRIQEFTYPFADDTLLVMHSDGLATRWQLTQYPGLRLKHPSLIAGVLYRDHRRERDDVTVLVAACRDKNA